MPPLTNYTFGKDGVNLVKDPLQLGDSEATQLQNAEVVPDEAKGGEGSLSKRGGLGALNGSALAGSVLGAISLPLQTTFTRTLVAFLGSADSDTIASSTDGTTWAESSTPKRIVLQGGRSDASSGHKGPRRCASIRGKLLYEGNDYTNDSTNPPIQFWDGTNAGELTRIVAGPASTDGSPPTWLPDFLVANGKVYFCALDQDITGEFKGAVYELNMDTGVIRMVAQAFGDSPHVTGGFPRSLCWYQGRLWVAQHAVGGAGSNIGKLVSCDPDVDSLWRAEGSLFRGLPTSMAEFLGELYIACEEDGATQAAGIVQRVSSSGAYTNRYTANTTGDAHMSPLIVFNGSLYSVEFHDDATNILHVKKSDDGVTWVTDLDMDSAVADSVVAGIPLYPGDAVVFDSKLYIAFRSSTDGGTDGFVMQRTTGGTWTKVLTGSIQGTLGVLVQRS